MIKTLNQKLLLASKDGSEKEVSALLRLGADVDARDDNGLTPLIFASFWGNESIARLLIDQGADLEAKSNYGGTALVKASEAGQIGIVSLLLTKGANIEAQDEQGNTPLLGALRTNETETAKLLLKSGARVRVRNVCGKTPIDYAQIYRNQELMYLLNKIKQAQELSHFKISLMGALRLIYMSQMKPIKEDRSKLLKQLQIFDVITEVRNIYPVENKKVSVTRDNSHFLMKKSFWREQETRS